MTPCGIDLLRSTCSPCTRADVCRRAAALDIRAAGIETADDAAFVAWLDVLGLAVFRQMTRAEDGAALYILTTAATAEDAARVVQKRPDAEGAATLRASKEAYAALTDAQRNATQSTWRLSCRRSEAAAKVYGAVQYS